MISLAGTAGTNGGGHDVSSMGTAPYGGGGGITGQPSASGPAQNGAAGADGDDTRAGCGGGGGGAYGGNVGPGVGGDGGAGGYPGGGGGGGGAALGQPTGYPTTYSGKGGDGGAAQCLCFTWA